MSIILLVFVWRIDIMICTYILYNVYIFNIQTIFGSEKTGRSVTGSQISVIIYETIWLHSRLAVWRRFFISIFPFICVNIHVSSIFSVSKVWQIHAVRDAYYFKIELCRYPRCYQITAISLNMYVLQGSV